MKNKIFAPVKRILMNETGSCSLILFFLLFTGSFAYTQDIDASRRAVIKFGTDAEIVTLIQALRTENSDNLDNDLAALIEDTRNQKILSGVFGFFAEREKAGLEQRAIKAVTERDDEANETVLSAIEYLGRIKYAGAASVIMNLLDTEERRFYNTAFRALGRTCSSDSETADEVSQYLVDFYELRDPGDDNKREVIIAIGMSGSSIGLPLIIEIASNTNERIPLRIAALEAIAKIGDPQGLDAVLDCAGTNDPNVRAAAISALGPFTGETVDKAILDAFRDSYYRTRIAAAQASRQRKFEEAVPYLQYRAERDETPNVKDEAIRALGEIASQQAVDALFGLFSERKNPDRVRILSAEMLMKTASESNLGKLIAELDDAKTKNITNLYNGFLKVAGETVVKGDKSLLEDLAKRFLRSGTIIEKSYGLDMAVNNNFTSLAEEITAVTKEKNESIARKAHRTAERLGITIVN